MLSEEWRPVEGFVGVYTVSNLGRVRREKRAQGTRIGHILRPMRAGKYVAVDLARSADDHERRYVHDVVATAFHGARPEGQQVNHKDTDKRNNRADNLEWMTPKENMQHAVAAGRIPTGDRDPRTKVTDAQVAEIRTRYAAGGVTQRTLADALGVDQTLISRIVLHKNRRH